MPQSVPNKHVQLKCCYYISGGLLFPVTRCQYRRCPFWAYSVSILATRLSSDIQQTTEISALSVKSDIVSVVEIFAVIFSFT